MGFFDGIGRKISQTGQNIVNKANEVADVSKYNSQIADEEKNIKGYINQLGQAYYERYGQTPHEGMEPLCNAINASRDRIAEIKKQILSTKKIKTCPNCGAECDSSLAFCGSCGAELPKEEEQGQAPAMKYCSKCGKQIAADAVFCPFCGSRG